MAHPLLSYALLWSFIWSMLAVNCVCDESMVTVTLSTLSTICTTSSSTGAISPSGAVTDPVETSVSGMTTDSIATMSAAGTTTDSFPPSATSLPSGFDANVTSGLKTEYAFNWNASITDTFTPSAIPEPSPHPISEPAAARLVRTVQDQILTLYNAYGTYSCAAAGSTLNCKGPWLYTNDWDNGTLKNMVYKNTAADPRYYCSFDSTYLQPSSKNRNFYGFSADNLTTSVQNIANYTSLWAAGACMMNQTCADSYKNNTEQMYADFHSYIQTGFIDGMTAMLSDNTKSYCPRAISGTASLFEYATAHFDGGREYYGLHNALFLPGVAQSINGTVEEARLEMGLYLANNARRAEGTFLNMIFFTPAKNLHLARRSGDEEVYPGCSRREYVMKGHCEGVMPPRDYDLSGEYMPMKDRDQMEVWGQSRKLENTGLLPRDAACDRKKDSIAAQIKAFAVARDVFNTALDVIAVSQLFLWGVELGAAPWAVALHGLAVAEFLVLATIAECEPFHTCNGWPPAIINVAKKIGKFQAGLATKSIAETTGVKNLVALLRAVVTKRNLSDLRPGKIFSGVTGAIVGIGGTVVESLLADAQKYFEMALACCGDTCDSSTCTQASLRCILNFGSQWSGSGSLNCAAI